MSKSETFICECGVRAALKSQDREDAERWKFIQRKWEDMKASDCSTALYCLGISREGVDVVEQSVAEIIDHARRGEEGWDG